MARYATSIEDTIGFEIYNIYVKHCTEANSIPDPYVFWEKVLVADQKYPISRSGFTHWLTRLQIPRIPFEAPYIWRDPITKAWNLRDVKVLEK